MHIYKIFQLEVDNLNFCVFFSYRKKKGTGGPSVVMEGKDALLTCVIMGPYSNDTVLWRKGATEILAAGMNRVTNDKRISILHDECKYKDDDATLFV